MEYFIDGVIVPRVKEVTLLGVKLNDKLNWDTQVSNIISKANKKLFIINKLHKSGFPKEECIRAYTTFIRPHLEYCSIVWGSSLSILLSDKLERCQRRALSIIERSRVDHNNYNEILIKLKLESLSVRRNSALKSFGRKLFFSSRYRNFLPPLTDINNHRTLRSRCRIIISDVSKHNRYSASTIAKLIVMINDEYVVNGEIFGLTLDELKRFNLY